MRKHKSSWPFLEPVNKEDVPDYYDIIQDPIGRVIYNNLVRCEKY
jgi:hypothetical protein